MIRYLSTCILLMLRPGLMLDQEKSLDLAETVSGTTIILQLPYARREMFPGQGGVISEWTFMGFVSLS
jgi:hypothetical protein